MKRKAAQDAHCRRTALAVLENRRLDAIGKGFAEFLHDAQRGLCAWCGTPCAVKLSHVDHMHYCPNGPHKSTYVCFVCVRGLVHARCNVVQIAAADEFLSHGWLNLPPDRLAYMQGEASWKKVYVSNFIKQS